MNLNKMYLVSYKRYYENVIAPSNDNWLKFVFSDPSKCKYFSFTKFYSGLVGRIQFDYQAANFINGNPLNWTLGYKFSLNAEKKLVILTCQYIILVKEEIGKEQIAD